jgi:hypothetical protein
MKTTAFSRSGITILALWAIGILLAIPVGEAAPQPPSKKELRWPYSLYAGDAFRACKSVNNARIARGMPELVESPLLADAGRRLINHMLREDWAGTSFPSGYSLKTALTEAGYPADATVSAVIRVAPQTEWKGYFGDSSGLGVAAAKACSPNDGFNPGLSAFGYFSIQPLRDAGRVDPTVLADWGGAKPEALGGTYEVMLFGTVAPAVGARQIVNFYSVQKQYNIKSTTPAATIVARRGYFLQRNLVGFPPSKFIFDKARIKGRLPKGVRFNGASASFLGVPKKKGNFRIRITAKYRKRADFTAEGTDGGVKTITVMIRVR